MRTNKFFLILAIIGFMTASCKKEHTGTSSLSVRLTDAPGNYDAVLIDLVGVEITGNGGNAAQLNVNAGIYNLLSFANGLDTLIATGNLQAGDISQVRLILGTNNTVIVDSIAYPLSTPSAQQSGLKLQVHETFDAGIAYQLILDFDANQSIVQQGNGTYELKPVIRVISIAISGSIKGKIFPAVVPTTITASNGSISYSTNTDLNGDFLLQGAPAGSYSVTITHGGIFNPVTVNPVNVTTGAVTDMGLINL